MNQFQHLFILVSAMTNVVHVGALLNPCNDDGKECGFVQASLCKDTQLQTIRGESFALHAACNDMLLIDSNNFDEEGNEFRLFANATNDGSVSNARLEITGSDYISDILSIDSDGEVTINDKPMTPGNDEMIKLHRVVLEPPGQMAVSDHRRLSSSASVYVHCGNNVFLRIRRHDDNGGLFVTLVGPKHQLEGIGGIFGGWGVTVKDTTKTNLRLANDDNTGECSMTPLSRRRLSEWSFTLSSTIDKECMHMMAADQEDCAIALLMEQDDPSNLHSPAHSASNDESFQLWSSVSVA